MDFNKSLSTNLLPIAEDYIKLMSTNIWFNLTVAVAWAALACGVIEFNCAIKIKNYFINLRSSFFQVFKAILNKYKSAVMV